jgi:small subunit ribosomal protein S6
MAFPVGFHIQKQMKVYELSYVISPEMTSEEATAKGKELELLVSGREGIIVKQLNPIARTLSYQIKKHASGFFGVLEFQMEPEKLPEIEAIVQKDGKIVRHMVIIRKPQRPMKERRTRIKPEPVAEVEKKTDESSFAKASEDEAGASEKHADKKAIKEKVELKDIEEQLDELLG